MERVEAITVKEAILAAKKNHGQYLREGYRVTRVDHFDGDSHRIIIDW